MIALLVTAGSLLGFSHATAAGLDAKVSQPADVASSACPYRADRDAERNPPPFSSTPEVAIIEVGGPPAVRTGSTGRRPRGGGASPSRKPSAAPRPR